MPRSALRQSNLFADAPHEGDIWSERLLAAFADATLHSGFLPLAEQAIEACPGDAIILMLAAMAALLDERPKRALILLKRFSKRASAPAGDLLHALALNQLGKRAAARALLESNGLNNRWSAVRAFPGGSGRLPWLIQQLDNIVGRKVALPGRRLAARVKGKPRTATKGEMAARPRKAPTPAAIVIAPAPPPLPSVNIDIPFTIEFDVSPLLSALARDVEPGGRWFGLRERFAHLGLAQGFDELLCLPHLTGVEPLLHQIETVRKVLKQFRGRVLLADEVGLGKTIEAGMVLKEYALRGMAERILVLTPASLVGQWREELETKFGLTFATTHDPLLRDEPQAFWAQARIVASIATARRREHAERLVERQFDLVIVDEAHHLCDRVQRQLPTGQLAAKALPALAVGDAGAERSDRALQSADAAEAGHLQDTEGIPRRLHDPGQAAPAGQFGAAARPDARRDDPQHSRRRRRSNCRAATPPPSGSMAARAKPRPTPNCAAAARRLVAAGDGSANGCPSQHLLSAAGSSPRRRSGGDRSVRGAKRRRSDLGCACQTLGGDRLPAAKRRRCSTCLAQSRPRRSLSSSISARRSLTSQPVSNSPACRSRGSTEDLSGPEKDAAIAAFRDHAYRPAVHANPAARAATSNSAIP